MTSHYRTPAVLSYIRERGMEPRRGLLSSLPCQHRSSIFSALGYSFTVDSDDPDVVSFVESAYAPLSTDQRSESAHLANYTVLTRAHPRGTLVCDDTELIMSRDSSVLIDRLIWDVNQHVIQPDSRWLKLHAAVVQRQDVGLVIAGPMESGKSTLAAALCLRGYRYLSDEVCAIRLGDGAIDAYAKPLGLDPGSWTLLPELKPSGRPAELRFHRNQWRIPGNALPGGVARESSIGLILLSAYRAGEGTRIWSERPAVAMGALARTVFHAEERGARVLPALGRLVERTPVYRLQRDDLVAACAAVDEVITSQPPRRGD